MAMENVVHMAGGLGETSYAMNSQLQNTVISKAKPFVENSITDFFAEYLPNCLTIADMGCSCGPNTLAVTLEVIDAIDAYCNRSGLASPEFQIHLNDLYGSDFNTLFKSIPNFIHNIRKDKGEEFGPCFISGVPGSFYGRLFPSDALHFVHSSYSLHFLSQVPPGIENAGNMYFAKTKPPEPVVQAYKTQFHKDFTLFINSRSQEVVTGGRMVLTLIGRRGSYPTTNESCQIWELLGQSLREMISEGHVEEAKVDTFNLPVYYPSSYELSNAIQKQGSFTLNLLETFDVNWDASNDLRNNNSAFDKRVGGQRVSSCIRAASESVIVNHFGEEIIEELFTKFGKHLGEYMAKERGYFVNHLMCLTKK